MNIVLGFGSVEAGQRRSVYDWIFIEYDKADKSTPRPERYFHIDFGVRITYEIDIFYVTIEFWHINSRHAMSPDGTALISYPQTFTITTKEIGEQSND